MNILITLTMREINRHKIVEKLINKKISEESLRQLMMAEGLWKPKARKWPQNHHVWRQKKNNYGEMQQFDGSYHEWLENRGEESCLLLALNFRQLTQAGLRWKAKFDKNEGVIAVFKFWLEYFEQHELPCSIYFV